MNEVLKKESKVRNKKQNGQMTNLREIPEEEDAKSEESSEDDQVNQTEINFRKYGQGRN